MRIDRDICPVGQGAFYTEHLMCNKRHFGIAYDCGSFGKGHEGGVKKDKKGNYHYEIPSALENWIDRSIIPHLDYIFISHLHWDHINGIKQLLKKCNEENRYPTIVMPFIEEDISICLFLEMLVDSGLGAAIWSDGNSEGNRDSLNEWFDFYWNLFFGERLGDNAKSTVRDTKIFARDPENQDSTFVIDTIDDNTTDDQISMIKAKTDKADWFYITTRCTDPKLQDYADALKNEIKNSKSPTDFSKIIEPEILNNISSSQWEVIENAILNLNKQYGRVQNNLSMMLYSGTKQRTRIRCYRYDLDCGFVCCHRHECACHNRIYSRNKPGALYTGDMTSADAWKNVESKMLRRFELKRTIGLYQLSHHGHGYGKSDKSDNKFNLEMPDYISPKMAFCCYGSENTYNHPDYRLLKSYWRENIMTIAIDEDSEAFEQYIEVL